MQTVIDIVLDILLAAVAVAFFALMVWGTEPQHNAHNDLEMEIR